MTLLLILLSLLSAPQFRVREAAQGALSPANALTLPLLEWAETHLPTAEARRRAGNLVDRWYVTQAPRLARKLGRMPWIDHTICGHLDLIQIARGRIADAAGWPDWREATRLWVESRIAARLPFAVELERLWREEWRWRWQQGEVWAW